MAFVKLNIRPEYRDKLDKLAKQHSRSMTNMVEVLIDKELSKQAEAHSTEAKL